MVELTKKQQLLRRRDAMLKEMEALRNKVAGIDIAIAILAEEKDG